MNIPDYQHDLNRKEASRLAVLGFSFAITNDGYFVRFNDKGLGGAAVKRTRPLRGNQGENNRRDFLASALDLAKRSKEYAALPQ